MYSTHYVHSNDGWWLFHRETIKSEDVRYLFKNAGDGYVILSSPKVVKLHIPESIQHTFPERKLKYLDGAHAFISKGTFCGNSIVQTFVWIPFNKVMIFEGEPFETEDMPVQNSPFKRRFLLKAGLSEDPMPFYFREFQLNRFEIIATADYLEEISFSREDCAKKYPPLYFEKPLFLT